MGSFKGDKVNKNLPYREIIRALNTQSVNRRWNETCKNNSFYNKWRLISLTLLLFIYIFVTFILVSTLWSKCYYKVISWWCCNVRDCLQMTACWSSCLIHLNLLFSSLPFCSLLLFYMRWRLGHSSSAGLLETLVLWHIVTEQCPSITGMTISWLTLGALLCLSTKGHDTATGGQR